MRLPLCLRWTALLCTLCACSDKGDNGSDRTGSDADAAAVDDDGDGYAADIDCDDTDSAIHPDAPEVCDEVDNNCDGLVDDADPTVDLATASSWLADVDGDGFGDDANRVDACAAPAGHVATGGDCDDSNAAIHPDATEVCDLFGVDEDCNGVADDEDSGVDVASQIRYYADADGDGYGSDADRGVLACEPSAGFTADNSDCDDDNGDINPAAAEVCDGVDNDCDRGTSEAGIATFTDSGGNGTDYSGLLTGTSSAPATVSLTTDGSLAVCEGTWYVNLDVGANVDIINPSGVPGDVVLDGGGTATVISIATDGITVHLEGLSIENGYGTGDSFGLYPGVNGGGIDCTASGTTLTATSVDIQNNSADLTVGGGGGMGVAGCTVSLDDAVIAANQAAVGAGILVDGGTLDVVDSVVTENFAASYGGGMMLYDDAGFSTVSLDEVDVRDNSAGEYGGGAMLLGDSTGVELSCVGSVGTPSGFTENIASYAGGGLFLYGVYAFEADTCDFGTVEGGDDNSPEDISLDFSSSSSQDDDASFTCLGGACGTESTYSIGGSTSVGNYTTYLTGNVVLADTAALIRSFGVKLSTSSSSCTADFYLLTNSSAAESGWTVRYANRGVPISSTASYVDSGSVDLLSSAGTYYALVAGTTCDTTGLVIYYEASSAVAAAGFGTVEGYVFENDYSSPFSVWDSVDIDVYGSSFRMDAQVTVLGP